MLPIMQSYIHNLIYSKASFQREEKLIYFLNNVIKTYHWHIKVKHNITLSYIGLCLSSARIALLASRSYLKINSHAITYTF